jgi:hypothetical protein
MATASLSKLLTSYSKEEHAERIRVMTHSTTFQMNQFSFMNDSSWVAGSNQAQIGNLPTKIASLMIDSYYHLPQRPDMAFLYLWMAFNSTFHQVALRDAAIMNKNDVQDEYGIQRACEAINSQLNFNFQIGGIQSSLQDHLKRLLENAPGKLCSLIASTFLKSNAIKEANLPRRYQSRAIDGLTKKFPAVAGAIVESYGRAYNAITNPQENAALGTVDLNITDDKKSQDITRSLSSKIAELLSSGTLLVEEHPTKNPITAALNMEERVEFFIRFILYASRNNMSHGKVSSRLNSETANKASYDANLFMYVSCYVLLAVLFKHLGFGSAKVIEDSIANIAGILKI